MIFFICACSAGSQQTLLVFFKGQKGSVLVNTHLVLMKSSLLSWFFFFFFPLYSLPNCSHGIYFTLMLQKSSFFFCNFIKVKLLVMTLEMFLVVMLVE